MVEHRHEGFLGYRLFRTQQAVRRCLENALAPYGITAAQWNALHQLERRGPLTQRQLAEAVRREPATITRSIDKMERAGLVKRRPDPNDRRANVIAPTDAARKLLGEVQQAVAASDAQVTGTLTDDEMAQMVALLDRVYANCTEAADEGR